MFVFFYYKKLWLIVKMLFSYSSYQLISFYFFFWQKYTYKLLSLILFLSFLF